MSSTRVTKRVAAPREEVYRALLDPSAVARWRVPHGMSAVVHEFDAREGGAFRVSLSYDAANGPGKTTLNTDTYHGVFVKLAPSEQVVEVVEFETTDPALRGPMTITTTLIDDGGATGIVVEHEGLPPGVRPEDNELGTRMSLDNLAELVSSAKPE